MLPFSRLLLHTPSHLDLLYPIKPPQDRRLTSIAYLRSLGFRDIDARLHDIATAYSSICDWLFSTTQFQKWRDRADLPAYNGVL